MLWNFFFFVCLVWGSFVVGWLAFLCFLSLGWGFLCGFFCFVTFFVFGVFFLFVWFSFFFFLVLLGIFIVLVSTILK